MINNNNIPQSAEELDPDIVVLQKAIRQKETENKAILPGEGSSVGGASRYQYTHNTWKEVAGNYLGDSNAPLTLENENKATYLRLKDLRDQGYSAPQIASIHNAGITKPNAYKENWKGTNKWGVKYDTPKYVSDVMNIANQMRRQNTGYNNVPVSVKAVNPETENKASFEYNPNDSLISGVGKTIGNAPKSVWNLLKGIGSAIAHPIDTIGAVGNLAKGTVGYLGTKLLGDKITDLVPTEEEQAVGHFINRNNNKGIYADNPDSFVNKLGNILGPSTENIDTAKGFGTYMKDRYGGTENIKKTLVEDPAGLALDASMLLSGGASTGAKVAGWADKANMVKTVNTLRKVGDIAQKTGEIIDPLRMTGKVVKPVTKPIGDILTKSGGDIQTEAFVKGFDTMGQKTIKNARKNNAYEWVDSKGVKRVEDPLQTAIEYGANKNYKIADGKVNFDATIENLNSQIPNNVEALVKRLDVEGKTLSVDEFRQAIVDGINSADTTQVFKKQLIDKLDSELKWYKDTYPNDQIPMSELYKRKVELDKVYNPETIDLNRSMGDSIRTKLYNATEDGIIKDLLNENRKIINARDLLIKANNATVRGGRIGTAMGRLLGTGIGGAFGSVGGPLGASVGGMAGAGIGDAIAKVGQARTFRSLAGDIKGGLEKMFGKVGGTTKTGSEILQETANTVRPVPQMTEEMKYLPAPEMAGSRTSVNVPIELPRSARENFLGMDTSRNAVIKNPADRRKLVNIFGGEKALPREVIDRAYPNAFKKIDQIIQEPKIDFKSIPLSEKGGAVANKINSLGIAIDMHSELNALRGDLVKQLTQIGDKNALSNVEAKIKELDAYISGESGRIMQNLKDGFISTEEAINQAMKIPVFRQLREQGMVKLANEYLHSKDALGSYMEGVIKFVDNPHATTLPHETFHATMDLVLSAEEKASALQTAKRILGNTADDLQAEEFLAQSFAEWYVKGSSKTLPQIITEYFKRIKQFFTGIVDDQDKIEAMFRDISKREIQKPAGVTEEMWQRLIHTTDKKGFDGILKKGFDEKKRSGNRYGLGEYFTIKNKENPLGNSFYGKYKVSTKNIDLSELKLKELSEYNKFGSKRDLLMDMGEKEMGKAGVDNNLIEKFIYDEDASVYSNFLKNKGYDGIKIGDSEVLLFDNELSNKLLDRKYTEKINETNKEKFQKINLNGKEYDINPKKQLGELYHGTNDLNWLKRKEKMKPSESSFVGHGGIFYTKNKQIAEDWIGSSGGNMMVNDKGVLSLNYKGNKIADFTKYNYEEFINDAGGPAEAQKILQKKGFDGIIKSDESGVFFNGDKINPTIIKEIKSGVNIDENVAYRQGYNILYKGNRYSFIKDLGDGKIRVLDDDTYRIIKPSKIIDTTLETSNSLKAKYGEKFQKIDGDNIKIYRGQKDPEFSMGGKSAGVGKSFTTDKKIAEVYGSDGTIIERSINSDDILKYNELDKETQRYIKSIIDERIDRVKFELGNDNIKPFEELVLELGEIARIKNKKAIDISSFGIPSESEIRILSDSVLKSKSQINSNVFKDKNIEKFQKSNIDNLIESIQNYKPSKEEMKFINEDIKKNPKKYSDQNKYLISENKLIGRNKT